jgi:hypothetical protein
MKKFLFASIILVALVSMNAQDVVPVKDGDKYSLTSGDLFFEIDANFGAQVSSFKIGGSEILFYGGGDNQGSTFWTSPQSVWNWPPIEEHDSDPYTGEISGNEIILTGEKDPDLDLSFKKTISANSVTKTVTIKYEINNEGSSSYSVAGWEVTRVPTPGGLTFFPKGGGSVTGSFAEYTEEEAGLVWYDQDASDPSGNKFFCDGSEGWLAHVNSDDILFVKTFDDVPQNDAAPGEEEVEFWHAGPTSYIELENQSAYESVPAEGTLTYIVKWYAEELPAEMDVSVGSTDLIAHVRAIVDPTAIDSRDIVSDRIIVGPNPVSDQLMIRSARTEAIDITIYDITGKEMIQRKGLANESTIDISELNGGIYFYSVRSGGKTDTGKLVVR